MKSFFKYFFNLSSTQYIISYLLYVYLQLVYYTSKKQIISSEGFDLKKFYSNSGIYVFWHNRLAFMAFARPPKIKTNVLISDHRDGKIISKIMKNLGLNVISGSSNRNSYTALKSLIKHATAEENIAITPDGPKGPKYQINSNVITISSLCQKYIIPMSYSCKRGIIFNSWDKLILPTPFNEIVIIYGTPIKAERALNKEQVIALNNQLAFTLNSITNKADQMTKLRT